MTTAHARPFADGLSTYEGLLEPARERFASNRAIEAIESELGPERLEIFLFHFHARGVAMTEPVFDWITTAAENCERGGLDDIAKSLHGHAKAEKGHHIWMMDDARAIADRWNADRRDRLDPDAVMGKPPLDGSRAYMELHEEVIAGETPYAQFALQYEMERLPVKHGRDLITRFVDVIGDEIASCLTFLEYHVLLDIGHTQFNRRHMRRLIAHNPARLELMADRGAQVLAAYGAFLEDVFDESQAFADAADIADGA